MGEYTQGRASTSPGSSPTSGPAMAVSLSCLAATNPATPCRNRCGPAMTALRSATFPYAGGRFSFFWQGLCVTERIAGRLRPRGGPPSSRMGTTAVAPLHGLREDREPAEYTRQQHRIGKWRLIGRANGLTHQSKSTSNISTRNAWAASSSAAMRPTWPEPSMVSRRSI